MSSKLTPKSRIIFTAIATALVWAHILWDYTHGGVPTHYILQSKDMPGFSNWWGGILLPVFTWILLHRIDKKLSKDNAKVNLKTVAYGFFGALFVGIILSFFFSIGSEAPGYMLIGLIAISFLIPLFKAEHYLGFVIGMIYTFGVILPIIIGAILTVVFFITYHIVIIVRSQLRPKDQAV